MKSRFHSDLFPWRRSSHTRLGGLAAAVLMLGVMPAVALTLVPAPAVASARPERVVGPSVHTASARPGGNTAADLSALGAYRTYLSALSSQESASAAQDTQLVQNVTDSCPDALDDLSGLSADQLKRSALTDFADEVDGDLDLAYMGLSRTALTRFASALSGLHWGSGTSMATTKSLIGAESAMLALAPSDICADANTLDAAPLNEPTATVGFLRRYRAGASHLHRALAGFQTLLARYETTDARTLVAQINKLVSRFSAQSSATEQNAAAMTLSTLGASQH